MAIRKLAKGMGEAVAKRTILRTKKDKIETWDHVALRVALGNTLLHKDACGDYENMKDHISSGRLLMSGRHLQHGDKNQPQRNMEVFTNCATASTSAILFYLLLNGSGVGRAYDDDLCLVDWKYMPDIRCVLSSNHPDFRTDLHESKEEGMRKYINAEWHEVEDSREGWAKAVEILEVLAYERAHKDALIVFDFSSVRPKGYPIGGMQDRPASGPTATIRAFNSIYSIKHLDWKPWKQALWIDHYLADCVLVGGARRSARMSTKWWEDDEILDFIKIKAGGKFLWSSNNSVAVDEEFWKQDTQRKKDIFEAITSSAYYDQTGEPGIINVDKLVQNNEGLDDFWGGHYVGSKKYQLEYSTRRLMAHLLKVAQNKKYTQITNPCGEISLHVLGGYCVIADVVPYFADSIEQAEDAFRAATRALIRVNTMDALYYKEVKRTNRIGVGITGLHEFAWKFFGYGFRDIIDEEKSKDFWQTLERFRLAVEDEAKVYSLQLGVNIPHTFTTIKPAGTTSKLFALTEGAHLPSMKEFLRWVQFTTGDPLIKKYADMGYPTRELKFRMNTSIVGFPTQGEICKLGMGNKLVTAPEATPEEQYQYIRLMEKYYMGEKGNQLSYTLKYFPDKVSYEDFKRMILDNQRTVRCCSVMPQIEQIADEYQPEEPISSEEFIKLVESIKDGELLEDIDLEHLKCSSGACPI